eukprot:NODE_383_length_9627_cov_0.480793.p4 type:complete len:133 gc:universal NODE_383_length_9627_cov_0.480793:8706-9104(+)
MEPVYESGKFKTSMELPFMVISLYHSFLASLSQLFNCRAVCGQVYPVLRLCAFWSRLLCAIFFAFRLGAAIGILAFSNLLSDVLYQIDPVVHSYVCNSLCLYKTTASAISIQSINGPLFIPIMPQRRFLRNC